MYKTNTQTLASTQAGTGFIYLNYMSCLFDFDGRGLDVLYPVAGGDTEGDLIIVWCCTTL
jgi:hypothetical protein